jgi:signal-transduction protein with cAMP-binding, CBS, and nucleotidyltransferase domain
MESRTLPKFYDMNVPIRAFVTKRVIGVDSTCSVQEAAKRMVEFNISSITIVENDRVIGFITDNDLKKRVVARGLPPDTSVREIMTSKLITVDISTTVKEALRIMAEQNIKHILVEEEDRIVGIMTFRDLIDMERHTLETYISRE